MNLFSDIPSHLSEHSSFLAYIIVYEMIGFPTLANSFLQPVFVFLLHSKTKYIIALNAITIMIFAMKNRGQCGHLMHTDFSFAFGKYYSSRYFFVKELSYISDHQSLGWGLCKAIYKKCLTNQPQKCPKSLERDSVEPQNQQNQQSYLITQVPTQV